MNSDSINFVFKRDMARSSDREVPYTYNPLKENRAIRFVRLMPASGGPVHCQIFRASLDDKEQFAALSYCWGSMRKTKSVICNGRHLKITDNLMAALLRLRQPDEPRVLWIDAICINQEDVAERNRQISLIREVYMKAQNLFIWLGGGDQYSTAAVNLMRTLSTAQRDLAKTGIYKPYKVSRDQWLAFSRFLQRGWFERMWVIQELAFAESETTLFLCGRSHEFQVDDLKDACDWCSQIMFHMEGSKDLKPILEEVMSGVKRVLVLCELSNNSTPEEVREGLWRQWLLSKLADTRDKKATDPRDRLFALYGFLHHEGQAFATADYSKSVGTVYHEFALDYITSCKSMDIISEVEEPSQRVLSTKIPSWVPDWSLEASRKPLLRLSSNLGSKRREDQACGPADGVVHMLNDHTLLIDGIWFDEVVTVSEPISHEQIAQIKTVDNDDCFILNLWNEVVRYHDPYPSGVPAIEAYYKTLICGREERDKHLKNFVAFWHWIQASDKDLSEFCLDSPEMIKLLCGSSVGAKLLAYLHDLQETERALQIIKIDDLLTPVSTSPIRGSLWLRDNRGDSPIRGVSPNPFAKNGQKSAFSAGMRNASHKRFRNLVTSAAANRVLFTTGKGYIGLGVVGTKVCDTVAVLSGGKTPFILRKAELNDRRILGGKPPRSPLSPLKTYSFVASVVGECYIHGLMNGEAVPNAFWDRIALV